jgi:hypothetical protein
MPKTLRKTVRRAVSDTLFERKPRQTVPHEFVLDALTPLAPTTRSMFGCLAVYVEEKIVLILRDRKDYPADNGVWLGTTAEHHESLRREFPSMRSIQLFGQPVTHWQVLPAKAPDFEESALHACRLILARDPRIGKVPKARRASKPRKRPTPMPRKGPTPRAREPSTPRGPSRSRRKSSRSRR